MLINRNVWNFPLIKNASDILQTRCHPPSFLCGSFCYENLGFTYLLKQLPSTATERPHCMMFDRLGVNNARVPPQLVVMQCSPSMRLSQGAVEGTRSRRKLQMGRNLAGAATAMTAFAAIASAFVVLQAQAFVPGSTLPYIRSSSIAGGLTGATHSLSRRRARRASSSIATTMKVAATQDSTWQNGGLKTREIFNALSQGEIGKRDFTQALARRILAKVTGMQREYELEGAAASLAASSSAAVGEGQLTRCGFSRTTFFQRRCSST